MCQKGMGALGSIIYLFAAEAASGMAWFLYFFFLTITIETFTFMHVADAFIQSDLVHSGYNLFLSVCVFPGNLTYNILRC